MRKRTEEEIQSHLEQFKSSELSRAAYAQQQSIPKSTFQGWVKKELESRQPNDAGLIQIPFPPPVSSSNSGIPVEFHPFKVLMPLDATADQWRALSDGLLSS